MFKPKSKPPRNQPTLMDYYPPLDPVGEQVAKVRHNVPLFVNYPDGVHLWLSPARTSHEYHLNYYREACPGIPIHTLGQPFLIVDNSERPKRRRLPNR